MSKKVTFQHRPYGMHTQTHKHTHSHAVLMIYQSLERRRGEAADSSDGELGWSGAQKLSRWCWTACRGTSWDTLLSRNKQRSFSSCFCRLRRIKLHSAAAKSQILTFLMQWITERVLQGLGGYNTDLKRFSQVLKWSCSKSSRKETPLLRMLKPWVCFSKTILSLTKITDLLYLNKKSKKGEHCGYNFTKEWE